MRKILLSFAALLALGAQAAAADNYAATAGSGLTFGAKDAAGVLYSRFIGCDNTTVSQCWSIDSSGRQLITVTSGSVASGAYASGSLASGAVVDLTNLSTPITPNTATATKAMNLGMQYNSTQATFTNGQQGSVQGTSRGALYVATGADTFTATLAAETTKVIGTVRIASGGVASGAYASGAFASGSIASGAMVDLGAQADSACGTDTGTCSLIALMKRNNSQQTTLGTSALPAQANTTTNIGMVTHSVAANGGATPTGNIVANNTTAVVVKASAGTLYGVQLAGLGSAPAYLKIYNATSATCGSGTPVKRLMIPAASTAANGAGSNITFGVAGVAFSTGITYCVTTGIADNDTTAPAASTFLVNIDWN